MGTIAGTANINQAGVGSVAGSVDGQTHGLGGAPVGNPMASTSLTTAATLTSALDGMTGYIARNQGQLFSTGKVSSTGAGTTDVRVESGATASNAANIFITDGGTGIAVAPEVAVYLANHAAAAGMFMRTLHDRLGELDHTERGRDGNEHRGAWARLQRDQLDTSSATGRQVEASTHSSVYQPGGELGRWDAGDRRWHWGAMGGYGQASTRALSTISGYAARGRVGACNAGLYATWYQSASQATGAYLDGWVMYGRARHRVHGDALRLECYDSSTWTTSIEGGYAIEWVSGREKTWYIEPQAQLIYSHCAGGDHGEVVHRQGPVAQSWA